MAESVAVEHVALVAVQEGKPASVATLLRPLLHELTLHLLVNCLVSETLQTSLIEVVFEFIPSTTAGSVCLSKRCPKTSIFAKYTEHTEVVWFWTCLFSCFAIPAW